MKGVPFLSKMASERLGIRPCGGAASRYKTVLSNHPPRCRLPGDAAVCLAFFYPLPSKYGLVFKNVSSSAFR